MAPQQTTPARVTPEFVETLCGTVEYARTGHGPAVLLLHGAMGGWDQGLTLARLALGPDAFDCIAVSRPGYLGTPLLIGRTPQEQADIYARILDVLRVPQVAIVAISGGGQSAVQFALRHPARCRALVLISACTATMTARIPLRFHMMALATRFPALLARMEAKMSDPEAIAARSIADPELRAQTLGDPEVGPLFRSHMSETFRHLARRLPGTRNDIAESHARFAYPLEQVQVPTLAVHGDADEVVPFAQSEALVQRVPHAELLALRGGTHVSLFTHNRALRSGVLLFLNARMARS